MNSDIRWCLYRSSFPFGTPSEKDFLGTVTAPDKPTAERRGRALHGVACVARAQLAIDQAKREKLGPGVLPKREPKAPRTNRNQQQYRAFCATKRIAAKQKHQAELPLGRPPHDAPAGRAEAVTDVTKPNTERID